MLHVESSKELQGNGDARSWFKYHHAELDSRAYARFRHLPFHDRYDAVAETMAQAYRYAVRAEQRGELGRLTPAAMMQYFSSLAAQERRLAGTCTTDVLSKTCQRRHGYRAISLDQPRPVKVWRGHKIMSLATMLANERAERPDENARRNIDYPEILDKEAAGKRERALFLYLCETHGEGKQMELAREFRVNPAQITRSKLKIAGYLAKHNYLPSTTRPSDTAGNRPGGPK